MISSSPRPWVTFGLIAITLALVGLRLINLDADSPSGLSGSAGLYVDEGYKTLSARNQNLFGETKWNPEDEYRGWATLSFLTHWVFRAAFEIGGANLIAARSVAILFFAAFLGLAARNFGHRYPPLLAFLGLLALGLESTIFFFNRVALLEVFVLPILYGVVFSLNRVTEAAFTRSTILAGIAAAVTVVGIKASNALYLIPVFLSLMVGHVIGSKITRLHVALSAVSLLALLGGVAATSSIWLPRLSLDPFEIGRSLFRNPLISATPFLVLAGLVAACHGTWRDPRGFLEDHYRRTLVCLVAIGPLLLAIFPYDPLRYYVPFLPAYILLIVEWVHVAARMPAAAETKPVVATAASYFLILMVSIVMVGALGLFELTTGFIALGISGAVFLLLWALRGYVFHTGMIWGTIALFSAIFLYTSVAALWPFMTRPTYQARIIREDLARIVAPGQSIAGDWAPFLTLGTDIKSLYVSLQFNKAENILRLKPDYFLHTDTLDGISYLEALRGVTGVTLGEPLLQNTYNERRVVLYRLTFTDQRL